MMHHHAALWILGFVVFAASCLVVLLIAKAPEGHENEEGFHRDSAAKTAPRREAKTEMTASGVASESIKTA